MKRLFVFGCSMTNYAYATWSDLISMNFDEYYNYGQSGGSNVLMMNRLVEANQKFNFTQNDMIMVMSTGIGRYSFFKDRWMTHGDLYPYLTMNKNIIIENFVKDMWDDNYAVYISWVAINVIKKLLKDIPHKFFIGINNDEFFNKDIITNSSLEMLKEIMDFGVNKIPFDQWFKDPNNTPSGVTRLTETYKLNNRQDGHPSQRMHYEFVRKFLPEFDNDKTNFLFDYVEKIFDGTDQQIQSDIFNQLFRAKYDKSFHNPLFGQ